MFEYDVFLSYSSKDKRIVNALAERLKQDGLRVWLDDWAIKPGDSIPLKIQEGLEKSHTLLMCMSPAYFESEWGRMEHYTLLFRDPTNTRRRLIPLMIADCTPPDFIAHLKYIDWRKRSVKEYRKIIESCLEREERYKLALEIDPNDVDTLRNYGILLDDMGRRKEAEEHYKLALEIDPNDVDTLCNYGILLDNMGRQKEAEEHYKLALEIDPNDVDTFHNYGNLLKKMGRNNEAEEHYKLTKSRS